MRIRRARGSRELDVVDDVAAVARQLLAVALLGRRGGRLGELAGDAAEFDDRRGRRIGEHDGHLQKYPKEVADVVGAVLGEALGAIAALQQESMPGRDPSQGLLEAARLAGEHQRREARKLPLDLGEGPRVRGLGKLVRRAASPAVPSPALGHGPLRIPRVLRPAAAGLYTPRTARV